MPINHGEISKDSFSGLSVQTFADTTGFLKQLGGRNRHHPAPPFWLLIDIYWEPQHLAWLRKRKQIWNYMNIDEISVGSVGKSEEGTRGPFECEMNSLESTGR